MPRIWLTVLKIKLWGCPVLQETAVCSESQCSAHTALPVCVISRGAVEARPLWFLSAAVLLLYPQVLCQQPSSLCISGALWGKALLMSKVGKMSQVFVQSLKRGPGLGWGKGSVFCSASTVCSVCELLCELCFMGVLGCPRHSCWKLLWVSSLSCSYLPQL